MSEGTPTPNDMMAAYALDAEDFVKAKFNVELDYSEESVELIEAILDQLHKAKPKPGLFRKQPKFEIIDGYGKMLGGYVGEVMRRHWGGGTWKLESKAFPGQVIITLELAKGGDLWPHQKAGKRILNGPEDNIWTYFQIIRQKIAEDDGEEDAPPA